MDKKVELAVQTAQKRLTDFHKETKSELLEIGKLIGEQFPNAPYDIIDYHIAHAYGEITRTLNHWTISLNRTLTDINSQEKPLQDETQTEK